MRSRGRARPISIVDDAAVPPRAARRRCLQRLQGLLQQQNVTWTLDACAGDGRLRLRPFLDLSDPGDRAKLEPLAGGFYDIVLEAGGTIGSSQACGLARTQFLRKQYGELSQLFREIKDAFDPLDQFNPGKVIGDDPHLMLRNLKPWHTPPTTGGAERRTDPAAVSWGSGEVPTEAAEPGLGREPARRSPRAKNGDGRIGGVIQPALRWPDLSLIEMAVELPGLRHLPLARSDVADVPELSRRRSEAASPRSQANLIREVATGQVDPRLWGADEFKAHADLCIHCKLCRTECPSAVDVSSLMLEAKAAYVEKHGLPPGDWIFSRIEFWARLGSRFPIITNFLLSRQTARWLLDRMLGVSRHRLLPRARRTPFTRRAAQAGAQQAAAATARARASSISSTSTPIITIKSWPSRSSGCCGTPK